MNTRVETSDFVKIEPITVTLTAVPIFRANSCNEVEIPF